MPSMRYGQTRTWLLIRGGASGLRLMLISAGLKRMSAESEMGNRCEVTTLGVLVAADGLRVVV